MSSAIAVGLDGSPESMAGARWAAREALRKGLPVRLVHVWSWHPCPGETLQGLEAKRHWAQRILREAAAELTSRHPGLEIVTEQLGGQADAVLPVVAEDADLLVLGSSPIKSSSGFRVGSASMATVTCAERPVIVVRAGELAENEHQRDGVGVPSTTTPYRDVILGLDLARSCDELVRFAFEAAQERCATLRVLHCRAVPTDHDRFGSAEGASSRWRAEQQALTRDLTGALHNWRDKFPGVDVIEEAVVGRAAERLLGAADDTSLLIVGRRTSHLPTGRYLGPTALAVLHHSSAPVAVVPFA